MTNQQSLAPNVHIRPMARRNHMVFSLAAAIGLITAITMQQMGVKLPSYLLLIASLICAVFGIAKRLEPEFSFTLTPQYFVWHLKHSNVEIEWQNFIQLMTLKVNKGQGPIELNYLGLKIWDLSPVIENISVRSAKNLFHEYRSVLHVAFMEAEYRQEDLGVFQEDADGWSDTHGKKYTGVKGMFASRLQQIKSKLGSDLYIPITSLDRNTEDFIQLFNHYKQQSEELRSNEPSTD